ncbi:MAG: 2-oxoacid:acceptor oxidoreductase subunit alpha [Desulfobacula sp.]|jgi:2-oxoglutarate/2-oxoacid ferredoxin oxidoreductase subunit alpha|uniref:2-oxoacid:acceptor oxidoreductase subunit alpha n=1 Tax=Desulfobacula sp. TaxID=2593537 RepID=UPI001D41D8C8|nr:2-oxoacid:acceptor oxidoreductase subunit alpha [Desulfobacula sp.]MBT3484206.1 2-oxoacid:acceptor oxidoreductase subunit alpha [Desulfobacula sp.]MBT3804320.1 2-oxoacid:acceptor oxidoreductase subunit alpha [Desulfobacula sp.]MBT4026242.1 2-oxoacid:acceptor oxidoreductase subunit alpha [Desulfobacula sp.]MBT4197684.1 2-oxoacid:acceptor oxidoreductase subunit alpha [Desulfobacula sp.]
MKNLKRINDFVIRFANVNGSGSASANNLFAKAVFRLGVPVSPKNIFPSNIQGLPTWYEVRVSEQGYQGRRGGYDFIVAVNGQTLEKDYDDLLPGGYFFYDSTRALSGHYKRKDITLLGMPLTDICNREIENPKLRPLLKNIIYVGALAHLLDMDFSVLTDSIAKQFSKKPKLAVPNIRALELGFKYASDHFPGACKLSVKRSNKLSTHILMDGNSATALGAVYGGATVAGWYPITPSTSVIEAFDKFTRQHRLDESGKRKAAIIQAEDELAALGIAVGGAWNGARSFTATSGPGISLMNELLGLAYFAEIPVVVVNVQRAGPSTGMPTRTQQSDTLACAYASHGDTKHVLLFPCDPKECFEMAGDSFDIAETLQTPVILMSDLDLGMNDHVCLPMEWDDKRNYRRGKVLDKDQLESMTEDWGRYLDRDGDGICYRTYPGTHPEKGAYFTRGSSHDEYAVYTEDTDAYKRCMERLSRKWVTARTLVPAPRIKRSGKPATWGAIFFGTSTYATYEAIEMLDKKGIALDTMRLRGFPFQDEVLEFIDQHKKLFVIEQNRDGQMRTLLINELGIVLNKLVSVTHIDGTPIDARYISQSIEAVLAKTPKGGAA